MGCLRIRSPLATDCAVTCKAGRPRQPRRAPGRRRADLTSLHDTRSKTSPHRGIGTTPRSPEEPRRRPDEAVERFLDLATRTGFWQSVDLRVCAIRDDSRWINLVTRGFLDHRAPGSIPGFPPVIRSDFRAWQDVLPIAELPAVVRGIASGTADLGFGCVTYRGRSNDAPRDIQYAVRELAAPYRSTEHDSWSCHALLGHGSSMWDLVRAAGRDPFELEGMIRSGPNAYDGLAHLMRAFCARPRRFDIRTSTTIIELIAPLAVSFDRGRTAYSPECVTVALKSAADIFVAKAELHWTTENTGEPPRHGSVRLGEREWRPGTDTFRCQVDVPLRDGDATATLFINIGDRCVDCMSVLLAGSNPRMRAHNLCDPDGPRLAEKLRDDQWRNAKEFETAVGLLLFFLGFQVDPLSAQKGLGNAVDHLAHDPGSSVILAVECTVGPPDGGGKLGKLVARSADLGSRLPDSEVIAVLATARPRAELSPSELEKAERDDVVLLAREDLRELGDSARAGVTGTQVVRRLRRHLSHGRIRRFRGSADV